MIHDAQSADKHPLSMIIRIAFSNMHTVTFQCIAGEIVFIKYFGMPIACTLLAVS